MKTNGIITYSILSVWGLLIILGILTLLNPDWLSELSNPGKNIEAISIKNAGDNYLKSNNYPQAIAQYTAALKIVPDLKSAIANLAVAYQKTGNYNKAIISFNHLLTLSPEYPGVVYYNLGEIYENFHKQKAYRMEFGGSMSTSVKKYEANSQMDSSRIEPDCASRS